MGQETAQGACVCGAVRVEIGVPQRAQKLRVVPACGSS